MYLDADLCLLTCGVHFKQEGHPVDNETSEEVQAILGARLIKLAHRLLKMRALWAEPPARHSAFALETLQVWIPLAERAGLWGLKVFPLWKFYTDLEAQHLIMFHQWFSQATVSPKRVGMVGGGGSGWRQCIEGV